MALVSIPPKTLKRIVRRRQITGADRFDEVWDEVYVLSPLANNEHQKLASKLLIALDAVVGGDERFNIFIFAGANVSDRGDDWTKNYRCPDVLVFLPGNPAEDRETHWLGGPDFAVEILSRGDRAREKFAFYARVGVRELLLVERRPWGLELYRLVGDDYELVGKSDLEDPALLPSIVLPLSFRLVLVPGEPRPHVELAKADGTQRWLA